jgi:putative endopeptidase
MRLRAICLVLSCVVAASSAFAESPMPALSRANLDTTVAPCADFYRFANGGWIDRTKVPAAYPSWGSFEELAERNQHTLYSILERAAADKKAKEGSDTWKLGTYWCACMDSVTADRLLGRPIEAALHEIDALPGAAALSARVAAMHESGIPALFAFRSAQDPKHSDWVIAFAGQGGIGLPDRDYYLRTDSAGVETRRRYQAHIAKSFDLVLGRTGSKNVLRDAAAAGLAGENAARILALETALARASMTNVQRRDPNATYHKVSVDSLKRLAPRFDWAAYLGARGLATLDSINVTQPDFFHAVDSVVAALPLDDWKAYLEWKLIDNASPTLSRAFVEENFDFERVLSGAEAMLPRWKRCLRATDNDLGDLLGKAYIQERFPPAARERALQMVKNLEAALGDRIAELDWMGEATRQRALGKLRAFENKIGYPNTWRDYVSVKLAKDAYYTNRESARRYEVRRNVNKIGKPVDRGEWFMTPPTVNAFYSSSLNSINFPAGILQPPFFDASWDDAVNYGGIGVVIGHEMSHGFDDRGRQFDAKGNLSDWWTADDATRYKERAQRVVDQFNGYTVLDTLHLNGRLTLGENIADLGGVAVAYHALQKALENKRVMMIDGFTPDQRFFLSHAQVWREVVRPASMRTQVQTDPHSPGEWRVNGPLSNLPEFAQAFGCKNGDRMVRDEEHRARIW